LVLTNHFSSEEDIVIFSIHICGYTHWRLEPAVPASSPTTCSGLAERAPHRECRRWDTAHHEFGFKPKDAIAAALELAIAARVSAHAPGVIAAIDLDD